MSAHPVQCVRLVCDECNATDEGEYGEMHYSDHDEARQLAGQCDWTVDGDIDRCPSCSAVKACADHGHVPDLATAGEYCSRCEATL